jgi:hypothetical protein
MALRRRKRRGFSIDVFVKSRIIWQLFDGHELHISEPSAPAKEWSQNRNQLES